MTAPVEAAKRIRSIVDAAGRAFARTGFSRTQVSDIAREAGVALGTLYRYATSKEDLFAFALTQGMKGDYSEVAELGPARDVEAFFEARLADWLAEFQSQYQPVLLGASQKVADPASAIAAVYDAIAERRVGIRMLDRSAYDLPQLGMLYTRYGREPLLRDLTAWLSSLAAVGRIAPPESPPTTARFLLEACAWSAMHRVFSPGGVDIPDDLARRTTLIHLTAALRARSDGLN